MFDIASRSAIMLAGILVIAGCANDPAASLRQAPSEASSRVANNTTSRDSIRPYCPTPRSWVDRSQPTGGAAIPRMSYIAEDSRHAGICRYILGAIPDQQYVSFGPIPIHPREMEGAAEIARQIFPLSVGNTGSYVTSINSMSGPDVFHYRYTFTVLRRERINILSKSHDAFVVSRTEEGMFNNQSLIHEIYWIDTETLLPLRREQRIERGLAPDRPTWVATRIGTP